MSERSIAEIIGWEWKTTEFAVFNGVQVDVQPHPAVDDLLAWLRSRHITIDAVSYLDEEPVVVAVGSLLVFEGDWWSFSAPTLLAALEAAVHAVEETA